MKVKRHVIVSPERRIPRERMRTLPDDAPVPVDLAAGLHECPTCKGGVKWRPAPTTDLERGLKRGAPMWASHTPGGGRRTKGRLACMSSEEPVTPDHRDGRSVRWGLA